MKKLLIIFIALVFAPVSAFAIEDKTNTEIENYMNFGFWQKFNDDILVNNLIKVMSNNNDLKAATIKVDEAQRIVKMSFADELPHIGFEGYVGEIFNSSDEIFGSVKIPDYTETRYLLPLNMNYEVDIWGKNHLKTKAKKKQFEMIKQDERAAYIYISSIFASDYFNLIRVDKLIEYQNELISIQKTVIDYLTKKYECGTATQNDIDEAKKALTYFEEDLEKLYEKQDILKNQINTLLSDRNFQDVERAKFDNLNVNFNIPDKIEFSVLDNRPDKIKSELDLEKIGIDIKIAKRDMLPRFIITGNIGFNLYSISSSHNFLADLGVIPAWDLFTGGRKLQNLKLKKDTYNVAIERYEKTVLKSIQESNDALYSLKTIAKINSIQNKRLLDDNKLLSDTITKKEAGTKDSLDVLFREMNLINTKKALVMSETNKIISYINLYQALGGYDISKDIKL